MSSNMIRITGMNSGLDTESIIKAYTSTASKRVEDAKKKKTLNEWTQKSWQDLNTKIYSFYANTLSANRLSTAYSKMKTTTSNGALSVTSNDKAAAGVQSAKIKSTAAAAYLTGAKINMSSSEGNLNDALGIAEGEQITFTGKNGTKTIQIGGTSSDANTSVVNTMDDLVNTLKEQGINANFDANNQRLFLSAKSTGVANEFNLSGGDALKKLGLATEAQGAEAGKGAVKIAASDAELELNGATFKSDSNTFKINDSTYTINYKPANPDEEIAITTAKDFDGVYDVVKNMLKEYNELVNEMSKLYNASSAKGYEPLTDEQREAMSEKEIEEWEKKIKDSLLKGDDTLFGVMSAMTDSASKGYTVNGKVMHLTDLGIETQGYFEAEVNKRYALHINGDSSDEFATGKTDKLKSMIASDPESVTSLLSQMAGEMYNKLYEKMGTSSVSSIYKVYNDKELKQEGTDWEKKIKELETKLTDIEDKYYKKFASMEKLLSSINSKQSSLGSFFGQ